MEWYITDGILTYATLDSTDTDLVIPEGCREIGENAFENESDIVRVTLPSSVWRIGESAFSGCSSLQEINLESVEVIEEDAFSLTALRRICLDAVEAVPDYAFMGCQDLEAVSFPDSLHRIGEMAFWGCTNLKEVRLGYVRSIDPSAFLYCPPLKDSDVRWKRLDSGSFYMTGLELQKYENRDFHSGGSVYFRFESDRHGTDPICGAFPGDCLKGQIVKSLQETLEYVVIPENVVRVAEDNFANCTALRAVQLHYGMEIVGDAFRNCPNLKYLVIPGYDPETARFFFDEYNDGWGRPFVYPDKELGFCDYIGEASFRQDKYLQKVAAESTDLRKNKKSIYNDYNIILRSHMIRMNFFAFDRFLDLTLCAELPEDALL